MSRHDTKRFEWRARARNIYQEKRKMNVAPVRLGGRRPHMDLIPCLRFFIAPRDQVFKAIIIAGGEQERM
jgi:hypothetical protein